MNHEEIESLVRQGTDAYKAGELQRAHQLLVAALQQQPKHTVAWLWLSGVVQDAAERRYCLERVLELDPTHQAARRGLMKFPPEVVARSPLPEPSLAQSAPEPAPEPDPEPDPEPEQPQPPAGICSHPDCNEAVSRPEHTLCHKHWKEESRKPPRPAPPPVPSVNYLTATQLGVHLGIAPQKVNRLLENLGWIEQQEQHWVPLRQAEKLGAITRRHADSGRVYVVWPEATLQHKALIEAARELRGDGGQSIASEAPDNAFRKRFPAKHRTTDGHLVRSKAEMLIDNWLYMAGIVHAYERRLPIEEEVYCDFYLPTGKVYIEYWGRDNDPVYNERRKNKVEIYQRYGLELIELVDQHILSLDDHLPKLLIKYGIRVD
ncbi:MAG: hypothetical protein EI684_00515 [Candidatus Viridilinea halotolerans]|uniref:Tetratricopeptide repeat protein n=1 Tax=Candidatus Viridilinea halotolerans TaxID=2491704 RepID=A0A426UBT2_9CHLR|nr:MAG: hypothetical protein EI684_00515 [Candidatus Viridilinea halotolerans]